MSLSGHDDSRIRAHTCASNNVEITMKSKVPYDECSEYESKIMQRFLV